MESHYSLTNIAVGSGARSLTTRARLAIEGVQRTIRVVEGSDPDNPAIDQNLLIEDRARALELAFVGLHVPPETSQRVARWLDLYTSQPDPFGSTVSTILSPIFQNGHEELVMVKDIQFVGLCLHHLLPFYGHAAVGYIPDKKIIGLSKLGRLVNYFTGWPTLQEDITSHVAEALMYHLHPQGVMVILRDTMHSCMSMRGIKDPEANTTTSAVRGIFKTDAQARNEFLALAQAKS